MTGVITELLYIAVIIVLARYNADLILHDLKVRHRWNGVIHISIWAFCYLVHHNWFLMIAYPFLGVTVFDISLNLFRGRHWDYMTKTPTSVVDKIQNWVFRMDGAVAKGTYTGIVIGINVIVFILRWTFGT